MFTALVAVSLILPADGKEKELSTAAKKELAKLEGKWVAVKVLGEGREMTPPEGQKLIEFRGRKLLFGDKDLFHVADVDPSTDPRCIDFKALVDMGELQKGTVYDAIYKIDGNTLTIAIHTGGSGNRPGKFESAENSKIVLATFEREKK